MPISGEKCSDPTEHDRVIECIGDDKYNILDGKLVTLREPVTGLTRAYEAARSGLMNQEEGRVLCRLSDGTLTHW